MNENYTTTYIVNCRLESYAFCYFFLKIYCQKFVKGTLISNKNQDKNLFFRTLLHGYSPKVLNLIVFQFHF